MCDKNHTKYFCEIVLPLAAAGTFTYEIPQELINNTKIGSRVLVNFGKKKVYAGFVANIHTKIPDYKTKPIIDILDSEPILSETTFKLWSWISDYYMCTLGEVCDAALPALMKIHSETVVYAIKDTDDVEIEAQNLKKAWLLISSAREISINELEKHMSPGAAIKTTKKLAELKLIGIQESINQVYKPKTVRQIQVSKEYKNAKIEDITAIKRSPAQKKVVQWMLENPEPVTAKELTKQVQVSDSAIKSLIDKKILNEEIITIERIKENSKDILPFPQLTPHQAGALSEIQNSWNSNSPVLVHGVTSSGKTEIYFHLIREVINQGKQALMMLPEIALTGQIVNRFRKVFGDKVAVYHSRINASERVELWKNIKKGERFQIVVGPRSAMFLPYKSLGCIIIDEEHDRSYKQQDPAPRYNARDVAIVLAQIHNANVLLGSATPSFESIANHKAGKYDLVKLTERFGNYTKPEIEVVDYAKWWKRHKVRAHLTPALFEAIEEALRQNKQVILFQNRRGFSPYLQCFDCGDIPECPNCDVRLTYHKNDDALVCHYCGYTKRNTGKCPTCYSSQMRTMGFGTQKIEEELQIIFPSANIERFDQDSTRKKNGHELIIERFENKETDILIGTQMIAKGLDFKHVSVVGVLNADNLFSFPDFRSFERSMQLLTQVAGRAGRHGNHAKVIIQTSQMEHKVVKHLRERSYNAFVESELKERFLFHYPPFTRMIKIMIKHKNLEVCKKAATLLSQKCRQINEIKILGPQEPSIGRIQKYNILEMFIKMERSHQTLNHKNQIVDAIRQTQQTQGLKSAIIQADVDPY